MPGFSLKTATEGSSFTAADFVEAAGARLPLSVAAGRENLSRKIAEPVVNRLGLALTGFWSDFAWRRIQLVGNAEWAYLKSLAPAERLRRFEALLDRKAWLFVFTNGHRPGRELLELAGRRKAVVLETTLVTRTFSRIASFVLEHLAAPRTAIYGTMVEVCGLGALLEGPPGLGKSETALGLIKKGAALVADDLTCLRKDFATGLLFASAAESTAGYMEIRGIGIIHVPSVFGVDAVRGEKRLQLVVTFKRLEEMRGDMDRTGLSCKKRRILGVDVPNVVIPVSEGRDLVNLVETAAQQHKLVSSGRDPVADLSRRLRERACRATGKMRKEGQDGR